MSEPSRRTLPAATTGAYLVVPPDRPGPAPLLLGYHGYGESAAVLLPWLQRIAGAAAIVVSVEPLHRFYDRRTNGVVGSWMTRLDREQAVADNVAYVDGVVEAVAREHAHDGRIVHVGFSQGASMAWRAAALGRQAACGVIALGGDVPPELAPRVPAALIGRGRGDTWYTEEKLAADLERLRGSGAVEVVRFDGGHEWTEAFVQAATAFLARALAPRG
jgi:predicted esterase